MLDQFGIEFAKQVPSLGVLAFVVVAFLNHLKSERTTQEVRDKRLADTLRIIESECHATSSENARVVSAAMHENTKILGAVQEALHSLNRRPQGG